MAAKIGQSLMKKNRVLTEHNDYLGEQVGQITEEVHRQQPHDRFLVDVRRMGGIDLNVSFLVRQVAQLHHELNLKDELLQFYTNAADESEEESGGSPTSAFFKIDLHILLGTHDRLSYSCTISLYCQICKS